MKNYKHTLLLITFLLLSFWNGNAQALATNPKNEFRAVWIATVVNIDWPKTSTDNVAKQQADYI